MHRLLAALGALCAAALSAAGEGEGTDRPLASKGESWVVRVPHDDKVAYRGLANFDAAGAGGHGMLYPAPNLGGFVAAVITHGLLVETTKANQKNKIQAEADKVLAPFSALLHGYTQRDLVARAAETLTPAADVRPADADAPAHAWVIDSAVVFSMTQDQRALVLDNALTVSPPGVPRPPAYQTAVRVVSHPVEGDDAVATWTAEDGDRLKRESADLFAESLRVLIADLTRQWPQAAEGHRTFRYLEGNVERMERAEVVRNGCARAVIRTLRGFLMSVPPKSRSDCIDMPTNVR